MLAPTGGDWGCAQKGQGRASTGGASTKREGNCFPASKTPFLAMTTHGHWEKRGGPPASTISGVAVSHPYRGDFAGTGIPA